MATFLLALAILNLAVTLFLNLQIWWGNRHVVNLRDVEPVERSTAPSVSIVVAARNEQRDIAAAVASWLTLDYDDYELIVVNDRSTDETGAILDELARDNVKLNVVHLTELPSGWLGKTHALQCGSERGSGEWLLFSDADVVMQPDTLRRAVGHAERRELDHLPMIFRVRMPTWFLESFCILFFVYLWAYFKPWRAKNPHSRAYIGIGGFNLIRAEVYEEIGRHEPIRMRPDDDLKFGKLVKQSGYRQELVAAFDHIEVPWYNSVGEVIVGLEKNSFSGVEYSVFTVVWSSAVALAFNAFPFVAIFVTTGITRCVYLGVVAALLLLCYDLARWANLRRSTVFGFPLAVLLIVFIQWRTMILNLWHGGLRWRDTFYPLDELKANRL